MIKAIILDLDNTLMDFMKMKKASCESAMSAMIDAGLPVKHKEGMKILFKLYDKYGIEDKLIFNKFLKKTMKKIDWGILANGIVAYRKVKEGYLQTYPHVHPTLIELKKKGIKLAVLSDAPRMRAWIRLAALRLTDFFDIVLTHEDVGKKHKPHKLPFSKALKKLNLKPEQVLMVGDWPERDIKGAKNAGMKTCLAKYGQHLPRKGIKADYEIDDFKELLKIVK